MSDVATIAIQDLLDDETIRSLATPANYRLGQAILQIGRVDLIESGPGRVSARVNGSQRRKVSFWCDQGQLLWRCSCTLKQQHVFCKHCVALALTIQNKAGTME